MNRPSDLPLVGEKNAVVADDVRSALPLVGEKNAVVTDVVRQITDARVVAGFTSRELAMGAGFRDDSVVTQLLDEKKLPKSVNDIYALLSTLGIAIDRLLPMKPLSENDHLYWLSVMTGTKAGPMISSDVDCDLDPKVAVELYVRFHALKELCGSAA